MDDDEQDYDEGGLFDPIYMLTYSMYHVIHNAPDNAWLGVRKLIDYLTTEDEPDSTEALDIFARYSLTGWHPRDTVEETPEPLPEEEIDAQVMRFRDWLNEKEDDND